MKQFKPILTVIGFLAVVKALSTLIPTPTPTGNVTIPHDEVEITFIQESTAMNEYEYETLVLRAER